MHRNLFDKLYLSGFLTFTIIGSTVGCYEGYHLKKSNTDKFENIITTGAGTIFGGVLGAGLGLCWPIVIPYLTFMEMRRR